MTIRQPAALVFNDADGNPISAAALAGSTVELPAPFLVIPEDAGQGGTATVAFGELPEGGLPALAALQTAVGVDRRAEVHPIALDGDMTAWVDAEAAMLGQEPNTLGTLTLVRLGAHRRGSMPAQMLGGRIVLTGKTRTDTTRPLTPDHVVFILAAMEDSHAWARREAAASE